MQTNTTSSIRLADRLKLFPDSTSIQDDSLFIAGHDLTSLAAEHGTPLYVYDLLTLNNAAAEYQSALRKYYPAASHVTYAGKAFLCKAIAAWTQEQDLFVDCTGEGEIAIAVAANVKRERILVHGVNKSVEDLKSALGHAGTIVVDNLTELRNIQNILESGGSSYSKRMPPSPQEQAPALQIWLRLLPGVAVHTHHAHTQ